jgi:sulfur-oxidizing protein SoxY
MPPADPAPSSRRRFLAIGLGGPLALALVSPARATPEAMWEAIDAFTGGAEPIDGRVALEIPLLVENGNAVPLSVSVESPMTEEDHVTTVAIFNELNPLPDVARFHFTPRSGRAAAETRIRLSASQSVHAIARMRDGSLWSASADVIVTAPACREV